MITVGTRAQYARCSLEKELFINRAMFPSVPEGMSDASPLNLEILMASERSKSTKLARQLKDQNRERETQQMESAEPDVSYAHADWEEAFHSHLTLAMTEAGLNAYQIHFLLTRYGEYFIAWRERYGGHPTFTNLKSKNFFHQLLHCLPFSEELKRLIPLEEDSPDCLDLDGRNWLARYQLRLPTTVSYRDVSSLCSMHYHYNGNEEMPDQSATETDSVFEALSDEPTSGVHIQLNPR
jgi:hypothetical protein